VYFNDPGYLASISDKFGVETAEHIREMASVRLERRLLAA
jgi:hypothetical protein